MMMFLVFVSVYRILCLLVAGSLTYVHTVQHEVFGLVSVHRILCFLFVAGGFNIRTPCMLVDILMCGFFSNREPKVS